MGYMHQGGNQSAGQGGDYQKYMEKYAGNYTKYMHQGASAQGANATDFSAADYNKYIEQYAGNYTSDRNMSRQEAMDKYMKQYAGDYEKYVNTGNQNMTQQEALQKYASKYFHIPDNTSDQTEWAAKFQAKYAGAYQHYMNNDQQQLNCSTASECKTVDDLNAWLAAQKKQIHTYVPEAFQSGADDAVDKEFDANKMRILNITSSATADLHAQQAGTSDAKASSKSSDKSSSWPFLLATASTATGAEPAAKTRASTEQASSKSVVAEKALDLATTPASVEQGSLGAPAVLCMILIGGAVGVFFATRKPQEDAPLEGYTSLLV